MAKPGWGGVENLPHRDRSVTNFEGSKETVFCGRAGLEKINKLAYYMFA
jgi:hypothetical protein